jgi:hypothetical protein
VVISFLTGAIGVMLMVIFYICLPRDGGPTKNTELSSSIDVFFITGALTLILFYTGIAIYIFKRNNINFEFILHIHQKEDMHHMQFFKAALFFCGIFFLCLMWQIVKMKLPDLFVNAYASWSLACICLFALFCAMPVPLLYWKARLGVFLSLCNVVIAPIPKVSHRDFFMADLLTSLISVV